MLDGKYFSDPLAKETVPNPFGERNSVLTVFGSTAEQHLTDAENLPLKNASKPSSRKK
jgi:hypothetical protein